MNDFTKEELLIFKDAIRIYLRTPSPIKAEHLRDKLQSMIDNYCEHKWQMNNQLRCNKCGVKVG